jgi:putative restriction endonuclease
METGHKGWTREELIKVLALYFAIPFGKMHSRNPLVVRLGKKINRTASAVALKLVNFASLDKAHKIRGIAGMSNTSHLDREVWNEFHERWDALIKYSDLEELNKDEEDIISLRFHGETSVQQLVITRRGQHYFRRVVLAAYKNHCAITKISASALLRASHIIPWNFREDLRLEPSNGICLNSLHDLSFDRGLMTFDEEFKLVISNRLKDAMPRDVYRNFFEIYEGRVLDMPERFRPKAEYLEYHRNSIFEN